MIMKRRDFITGSAALAAYGQLSHAQSITAQIGGGISTSFDGGLSGIGRSLGPILAPYPGFVATRAAFPVSAAGASNLFANSRSWHVARANISALQIILPAYYPGGASTETTPGGNIVYTASIEYPVGSNKQQILFSGIAAGTAVALSQVTSDSLTLSTPIPAGATFRIWLNIDASATTVGVVYGKGIYAPLGDVIEFSATALTDKTMVNGATITQAVSPAGAAPCMPVAIVGTTTRAALLGLGDSRMEGASDTADASGDLGEVMRAFGPYFAYSNMGLPGDSANHYRFSSSANRKALKTYCSHVIFNFPGINDVATAFGLAQSTADLTANVAFFSPRPCFITTIPPGGGTSTDHFATTAGQTPNAGLATIRGQLNSFYRSGAAGTGVTGVLDIAQAVETSIGSGVWKADGITPNLYVADDGTHEEQFACLAEAAVINPNVIR